MRKSAAVDASIGKNATVVNMKEDGRNGTSP